VASDEAEQRTKSWAISHLFCVNAGSAPPVWNREHRESLLMTNSPMKSAPAKPPAPHAAPSPANSPGRPAAAPAAPAAKPAEVKK
jgi:hypothetical protein